MEYPMTRADLRIWAESHATGGMKSLAALAVLDLFTELDAKDAALRTAAERIAGQSEALSRAAETPKPFDGTYPMPAGRSVGRLSSGMGA